METFSFATSSALQLPVNVKIERLDGHQNRIPPSVLLRRPDLKHRASNLSPSSELYVTAQIWADSKPLTIPVQTPYKTFSKGQRRWAQWLTLPITYANIPISAQIAITVWDLSPTEKDGANHSIPFGGTTIPLFDDDNTLQKGRQRCRLHIHKAADGLSNTTTPWIIKQGRGRRKMPTPAVDPINENASELQRLEALLKKQEMGEIPQNLWLDQLLYRKFEKLQAAAIKSEVAQRRAQLPESNGTANGVADDEDLFFLDIELPRFDHPIVYTDTEYPPPPISSMQQSGSGVQLKPPPEVSFGPGINIDGLGYGDADVGRLVRIYDPEVAFKDNPVEAKHRRLIRSHGTGELDRDMKPNAKIRDELNVIMSYGPLHDLNGDEKDLVWKFRHHLTRDKRALTKFVKSVSWGEAKEAQEAVRLLSRWSEIEVDDALELLGPQVVNPAVRAYAVERLRKAEDNEILVYLLELVQALKFEPIQKSDTGAPEVTDGETAQDSSLARFLIDRAKESFYLGNFLYWYLMVEIDDRSPDQNPDHLKIFSKVAFTFRAELEKSPEGVARMSTIKRQAEFITILSTIAKQIRLAREDRPRKIIRLRKFLADPKNELVNINPPLPLPLDPDVKITGIYADDSSVLKSSLFPLLLNLRIENSARKYPIMFKAGDDLRQDQLVIQTIMLMDRLLRNDNLDLKLTPYRCLATSTTTGAVEFVPSTSLAAAVSKHRGSLLAYLRDNNPDGSAPLGVRKEAMETYIRSCAGYCVITYLLGIGDRHLDNLLISPAGNFFHVDFGYILGRDPKPFAPIMKLGREMIEGMGGPQHSNYKQFKMYAFTAYSILRKQANLILNLFALMREANIPDIKIERDKAVWKVQERLMLEMSEEDATKHLDRLIEDSAQAMMPVVIDRLHTFMQGLKK